MVILGFSVGSGGDRRDEVVAVDGDELTHPHLPGAHQTHARPVPGDSLVAGVRVAADTPVRAATTPGTSGALPPGRQMNSASTMMIAQEVEGRVLAVDEIDVSFIVEEHVPGRRLIRNRLLKGVAADASANDGARAPPRPRTASRERRGHTPKFDPNSPENRSEKSPCVTAIRPHTTRMYATTHRPQQRDRAAGESPDGRRRPRASEGTGMCRCRAVGRSASAVGRSASAVGRSASSCWPVGVSCWPVGVSCWPVGVSCWPVGVGLRLAAQRTAAARPSTSTMSAPKTCCVRNFESLTGINGKTCSAVVANSTVP